MYVTTSNAKAYYSVSTDTLRRWAKTGKISFILTKGGHRRYYVPDSVSTSNQSKEFKIPKNVCSSKIIYARVSSHKQKSDLHHQIQYLSGKFPDHTIVSDVGSGLNFRRKGLTSILDCLFAGNLEEIVVASKDRLARFGYELIEDFFCRFNARIIVVNDDKDKQFEEELTEDILSIITFFTARYSGKRKYLNKAITGNTKVSDKDGATNETTDRTKEGNKKKNTKSGEKSTSKSDKRTDKRTNKGEETESSEEYASRSNKEIVPVRYQRVKKGDNTNQTITRDTKIKVKKNT